MSFSSLLNHVVSVQSQVAAVDDADEPTYDEYNQPIREPSVVTGVRARISAKSAAELAAVSQAGVPTSDYTILLKPRDLSAGDAILHVAAECPVGPADFGDVRFEIAGPPKARDGYSRQHHLTVDVKAVGGIATVEGS